ncbi:MAG: PD-(D/E)XK nuclease family protein [Planctomycetaceae bacterium]|jgi:RecB family exonuclease|nr:PD-(D/E)XK nuclease family protein [Planctomycetaceae bacterium]
MDKVFFNWSKPFLPAVADYLMERYQKPEKTLDLSHVIVAVPGARAKRRLEELLFLKVEKTYPDWIPPNILTVGNFPELLYPQKVPMANDLVQQIAWVTAIRQLQKQDRKTLESLIPHLPHPDDWNGLLVYGQIFARLHLELAADGLKFQNVTDYCLEFNLPEEVDRWRTLAQLQEFYLNTLDALPLWDVQTARLVAVKEKECSTDSDIILAGLADLNQLQRKILSAVDGHVTSLIFAPPELEHLFDSFGCVNAKAWQEQKSDISDVFIRQADTPSDQATEVLRWLHELDGNYSPDEILIGVPDEEVVPLLSQQMEQSELTPRYAAGTPISQTPVFLLLDAVYNYLENKRFADFATLIRHPDVEHYLFQCYKEKNHQNTEDSETVNEVRESFFPDFSLLLTELDVYHQTHLPLFIEEKWLLRPKKESEELKASKGEDATEENTEDETHRYSLVQWAGGIITRFIGEFFADGHEKRRLPDWIPPVRDFLLKIYPAKTFRTAYQDDHLRQKSLEEIRGIFDHFESLPEKIVPQMTALDLFSLLLRLLQNARIPPIPSGNDIELIGWLDLVLDDAPALAVTGLNDGIVPSSKTSDSFLPDTMRRRLGLEDNLKRYARDAYAVSAILHSRENVRLIFGKHSLNGDPLVPSRLFFAAEETTIAHRVKRFFKETLTEPKPIFAGSITSGNQSLFKIPEPPQEPILLRQMRVTEFRDYLQCPYRYYLKHRLKLDWKEDADEELNAGAFGDLIHQTLKRFGQSSLKNETDFHVIERFLNEELEQVLLDYYGKSYRPVIAVQVEQARIRLAAFAREQAKWALTHEILHVEYNPDETGENIIEVDGLPVKIQGRIDRIDVHKETGEYFLLDYKTSGEGDSPEKVHQKSGEWVDLQLPLYRTIFSSSDLEHLVTPGFIVLPKDTQKTEFKIAGWTGQDYREADEVAQNVIRKIRHGDFWPPKFPPPKFSEIYSAICMDKHSITL